MPDRSTAVRQGMLLVCTNVDPAHEDDFNRWYDREHVNERVAIPGFVSGAALSDHTRIAPVSRSVSHHVACRL